MLTTLPRAEQEHGPDFPRLANALSALYPKGSEENWLLDAMLLAVPRWGRGMVQPIDDYRVTPHAAFEMERRGIDETVVRRVLAAPGQRYPIRPGRDVLQSSISFEGKTYLVRVFVDADRKPAEVVTVYRTSNIARYWRSEP